MIRRSMARVFGALLILVALSAVAEPNADPWVAWRAEIQADPVAAEARYQDELAAIPESTEPNLARSIVEIKLLSAQLAQGRDQEHVLARMALLADQAAILGDLRAAMQAWRECSRRYFVRGDYARAQAAAQHMLDMARQLGARKEEAQALNDLGVLAKRRGDVRTAIIHYENALGIRRTIGDQSGAAQTLGNLALIEKNRGVLLQALQYQREAHRIRERLGQAPPLASSHDSLGLIYLAMNDAEEAERQFRAALAVGDLPSNQDNISNSRNNLALALLKQGRVDEAEVLAMQVYDYAGTRDRLPIRTSAATTLSSIYRRRGDLQRAGAYVNEALQISRTLGDSKEIIEPLLERAEWHLASENANAAAVDLDEAMSLARRDQLRLLEYLATELYSRVLLAQGKAKEAFSVRQNFERMGQEILGADSLRQMAAMFAEGQGTQDVPPEPISHPEPKSRQIGVIVLAFICGWVFGLVGMHRKISKTPAG